MTGRRLAGAFRDSTASTANTADIFGGAQLERIGDFLNRRQGCPQRLGNVTECHIKLAASYKHFRPTPFPSATSPRCNRDPCTCFPSHAVTALLERCRSMRTLSSSYSSLPGQRRQIRRRCGNCLRRCSFVYLSSRAFDYGGSYAITSSLGNIGRHRTSL
jgi:hypothetical protein